MKIESNVSASHQHNVVSWHVKIMAIGMAKAISCVMAISEQRRQRKHQRSIWQRHRQQRYGSSAHRVKRRRRRHRQNSASEKIGNVNGMAKWQAISSIKWRKWRHGVMAAWRRKLENNEIMKIGSKQRISVISAKTAIKLALACARGACAYRGAIGGAWAAIMAKHGS
jgi:hypothetical protein